MNQFIFFDSGPLGLITHPKRTDEVKAILEWLARVLSGENQVLVPAIIYYEIKRELLRADKPLSVARLMRSATHRIVIFRLPIRPFIYRQNCGLRLDGKGDPPQSRENSTST